MKTENDNLMRSVTHPQRYSLLQSVSAAVSALLVISGSLVILGWLLGLPLLKSVSPDWVSMKVNTALCFILAGVSLWCLRDERATRRVRFLGRVCAVVIVLTTLLTTARRGERLPH